VSIPPWSRWLLAAILVVGIATAGVAANMAVLGSSDDDTRLGTLSARSVAPGASPIPRPQVDEPDDAARPGGDEAGDDEDRGDGPDEDGEGDTDDD
jgi:hypothetical protein